MTSPTDFMSAAVDDIAKRAGVKSISVKIVFGVCDALDKLPWAVRVALRSKSGRKYTDACGYGATLEEATAGAIADIVSWGRWDYVRCDPATPTPPD